MCVITFVYLKHCDLADSISECFPKISNRYITFYKTHAPPPKGEQKWKTPCLGDRIGYHTVYLCLMIPAYTTGKVAPYGATNCSSLACENYEFGIVIFLTTCQVYRTLKQPEVRLNCSEELFITNYNRKE